MAKFIDELITPMTEEVAECRASLADREEKLEKAKELSSQLAENRTALESQISDIQALKAAI